VLLLGRVWPLGPQKRVRDRFQVLIGHEVLGISGEPMPLARLNATYQATVTEFLEREVAKLGLADLAEPLPASVVEAARKTMWATGYTQVEDLILIAGHPPLIGCVLPDHFSSSLGRPCHGDLALTCPFTLPQSLDTGLIRLSERFSTGRWQPANPPHGLCWGRTPRLSPELRDAPSVALVALLRCLSVRFAQNGCFHSADKAVHSQERIIHDAMR